MFRQRTNRDQPSHLCIFSDYIETLNFYHDALADTNQTNSLINEGLAFYNQTNYKDALNYFDKALAINY